MNEQREKKAEIAAAPVLLRPFREEDEADCIRLLRDARVAETYMLPDFPDDEAARPLFLRLAKLSRAEDRFVYAVERDGRFAGFLNDVSLSREKGEVELGYALLPEQWNRSTMTAALAAAIDELFRLGFSVVRCGYFEGNEASRRVMEKCGMTPTGETEEIEYRGRTRRCHFRAIRKTP